MSLKLIEPKYYFENSHFDLELEKVFKENWLFGCLITEIPNKNDFYVLEIGKYSVIIYNNGKDIVALQNMCSHRFNRIFTEKRGNAPIVCPFHSWGFDGCGVIRNKKIANTVDLCKQLSLKRYQVEIIGKFVFFHFSKIPRQSLFEQLAGLDKELLLVSEIIDQKIHEESNYHKVNWKFICENVIDKSHCTSLHQETLVKIGYCVNLEDTIKEYGNNTIIVLPPLQDKDRDKRDKLLNKYLPRKLKDNLYKHTLIFPNLTIGIYEGLNITVGSILPINSKESSYILNYYFAEIFAKSKFVKNFLEVISEEVIFFGTKVFDEDKVILENVQKGVLESDHSGYVLDNEIRIKNFYNAYNNFIDHGKL